MNTRVEMWPSSIVAIFIVVLSQASMRSQEPAKDEPGETFVLAEKYSACKDWKEKRAFCMDLIDGGELKTGAHLKDIVPIFGDDVFIATGDIESECIVSVHFEPQVKVRIDERAPHVFIGWYIRIKTWRDGSIRDYYLSNLHK